jgi:two-component system LytT family response regulator
MLKAIIVEDEYLAREELAFLVGQHSTIEIVASFEDGLEAFKYLQDHEVDVVFLDIQIPPSTACCWQEPAQVEPSAPHRVRHRLQGLRWRRSSWRRSTTSSTLQRTAPHQSAAKARAGWQVADGAGNEHAAQSHRQTLVKGERIIVTPCEQIYYAEADEKLTYVYTRDDRYVMTMTSASLSAGCLSPRGFFCCTAPTASTSTRSAR